MAFDSKKLRRVRPALFLARNRTSIVGAALVTAAGISLSFFFAADALRGGRGHPYEGLVFLFGLPTVFVVGLVLIPIGMWFRWRALVRRNQLPAEYPAIDLRDPLLRRSALLVAVLTVVNIAIVGTASYEALEFMDSSQFCGLTCHSVMAPEYAAYIDSPHSRVACADCHIGPGASWFVRSKLDGTRQVLALMMRSYSRPIPSPVRELRPARETCEQCHWPQKFHGDKLVVRRKFADDEKNSATTSVLVMKVGGRDTRGVSGIHGRHLDAASRITYVATDESRQVIPIVRYIDDSGKTVEYVSTEAKPEMLRPGAGETRTMDCVDCHNRPTHVFQLPERAVDDAMASGAISPDLPWVKKRTVELLRAAYPDRETAFREIAEQLRDFYRREQPQTFQQRRTAVEQAATQAVHIYARNVFPTMNLTWGTHPNNLGHEDFLGCFRCHDDNHKAADGRVISQDCTACHGTLAMDESEPKVLEDLGLQ